MGVIFDEQGARRIVAAVRQVERQRPDSRTFGSDARPSPPRFLARLTGESSGAWAWEAVYLTPGETYAAIAGANSDGAYTAKPYDDDAEPPADAVVWLDFWGYGEGGGPLYRFAYSPPSPTPPLGLYRVELSTDGGTSDADPDATATYTYAITDRKNLDGSDPDAGQSPEVPRELGYRDAATLGTAYYDDEGKLTLFQAFEPAGTGPCDTDEESGGE